MFNSRLIAWSVWVIASVFYAYQYILRVMPSILINDIMVRFNIDASVFGQFSGVYYLGYSLMHIPIGIMLDRYGPRKILSLCIILAVIGSLPLIFTTHWIFPIIGRIIVGIASSASILGVFKIIRMVFPEKYFTRMLSLSVTIGLMGGIYGGGPIAYLFEAYGYEAVVQFSAALGIILASVAYIIIPDIKHNEKPKVLGEIKEVFGNLKVIAVCVFAGFMVGPIEGFADIWGVAFFKEAYTFEGNLSSSLPSFIFIGMCFGAPLLNLIAEKSGNYLATIIGAGIIMMTIFFLLITKNLNLGAITISMVIVGICCAYQILAIYIASTYVSENAVGLTTAVANMIIMIFGYAFHTVIGLVVDSQSSYKLGVSVIPIALLIGVLGFTFILITEKRKLKA